MWLDTARHEAYVYTSTSQLVAIDMRNGSTRGGPISLPGTGTLRRFNTDCICVWPAGRRVFVASGDLDSVICVDLEAGRVTGQVGLINPTGVVADPASGRVVAVGWPDDGRAEAVVFDGDDLHEVARFPIGAHNEQYLTLDPVARRVYVVGGQSRDLDVIDVDSARRIANVNTGGIGSAAVAVSASTGRVYVVEVLNSTIRIFDRRQDYELVESIPQATGSGWWGVRALCLDDSVARLHGTCWSERSGSQMASVDLNTNRHLSNTLRMHVGGLGAAGIAFDPVLRRFVVASPQGQLAVVDGATPSPIDIAHAQLGGDAGLLGPPQGDEELIPQPQGRYRTYSQGSIHWTPSTGAHETHGEIRRRWAELGWESGLGYPTSDETECADGLGRFSEFERGSIYWAPHSGAWEVYGAIGARWTQTGRERFLGYPLTGELACSDGIGRLSTFERGSIWWSPRTPATEVIYGEILAAYRLLDSEDGRLGYPIEPEADLQIRPGGRVSRFENGVIQWVPRLGTCPP